MVSRDIKLGNTSATVDQQLFRLTNKSQFWIYIVLRPAMLLTNAQEVDTVSRVTILFVCIAFPLLLYFSLYFFCSDGTDEAALLVFPAPMLSVHERAGRQSIGMPGLPEKLTFRNKGNVFKGEKSLI